MWRKLEPMPKSRTSYANDLWAAAPRRRKRRGDWVFFCLARVTLVAVGLVPILAAAQTKATAQELVLLPVVGDGSVAKMDQLVRGALGKLEQPVALIGNSFKDLHAQAQCNDISSKCLAKIGRKLAAKQLILIQYGLSAGRVEVTMRLFDVAHRLDKKQVSGSLPDAAEERHARLQALLEQLFGVTKATQKKSEPEQTGELAVSAPVYHVEVLLNGQSRGTAPLHLRNLPVGKYQLVARRGGYIDWQGTVEVKSNETTWVNIELKQAPDLAEPPGFMESIRIPTLIAAGVGVLALGAAAGFALDARAQQNKFDRSAGLTFAQIQRMQQNKDSGASSALISNILFGASGAALVTAVVLAILDYNVSRPDTPQQNATHLAVGAGSVDLRLRF